MQLAFFFLLELIDILWTLMPRCDDKFHKVEGGKEDDDECSTLLPLFFPQTYQCCYADNHSR
jgi:hypothetical protein